MKKNFLSWMTVLVVTFVSIGFASCGDDDDENGGNSIVGTWVDGTTTMILGGDGSYNLTDTSFSDLIQRRKGTYSYNPSQGLLTVNVIAIAGHNNAYQQTYIVQTLTATTLVLLYTDGDVEGYYTRQ